MKIRQQVFDTYWKFAAERQEIFFNRILNYPRPWTQDDILETHKFCNVYRASDRVSQYLIKHIIYSGIKNEEDVLFRIILFKIFNKIETWQLLEREIGEIRLSNFNFDRYSRILQNSIDINNPIYTSAYMSCANKSFGFEKKHQNHLALIEKMFIEDKIVKTICSSHDMETVFKSLQKYPLIGNFMAYQLVTDINYSEVVDFSEQSFTVVGPGSERGIKKCFYDIGNKSYEYVIKWMCENQNKEFDRLGLKFKNLWGRPLQYIDCQGLFCETDKYCRAAFPELKSNRKRIKAKFQANNKEIDFFYPPKWNINNSVKETMALKIKVPLNRNQQLFF